MNNIPAGYDENGVRNGTGKWEDMEDGEVSNCCGAKVEGSNGETGRCSECKEGCGVVKLTK